MHSINSSSFYCRVAIKTSKKCFWKKWLWTSPWLLIQVTIYLSYLHLIKGYRNNLTFFSFNSLSLLAFSPLFLPFSIIKKQQPCFFNPPTIFLFQLTNAFYTKPAQTTVIWRCNNPIGWRLDRQTRKIEKKKLHTEPGKS